jgi:hypothetical protein
MESISRQGKIESISRQAKIDGINSVLLQGLDIRPLRPPIPSTNPIPLTAREEVTPNNPVPLPANRKRLLQTIRFPFPLGKGLGVRFFGAIALHAS